MSGLTSLEAPPALASVREKSESLSMSKNERVAAASSAPVVPEEAKPAGAADAAAVAGSCSSAPTGVASQQQLRSCVVAEAEVSGAAGLRGRGEQLLHAQCLLRNRKGQLLMQLTKTMILAAADVARVDLERTLSQVKAGANTHHTPMPHTTLYCSRRDWALGLSSVLRVLGCTRTDGRAGFFWRKPPCFEGHLFHPFLCDDVTSVDCTGFSADWMGHGYFREHRQVLTDMSQAFAGITSTGLRTAITAAKDGEPWKCTACNEKVMANESIELYTVMTVEEQHAQQLQLLRRQLQLLAGCETLQQWKDKQQDLLPQQQELKHQQTASPARHVVL